MTWAVKLGRCRQRWDLILTRKEGEDARDVHEQLLVGVAGQLGVLAQPLGPRLADNGAAAVADRLVERRDLVKVDLLVEAVLERRRDIVRVVVDVVTVAMAVAVVVVFVRARHGGYAAG